MFEGHQPFVSSLPLSESYLRLAYFLPQNSVDILVYFHLPRQTVLLAFLAYLSYNPSYWTPVLFPLRHIQFSSFIQSSRVSPFLPILSHLSSTLLLVLFQDLKLIISQPIVEEPAEKKERMIKMIYREWHNTGVRLASRIYGELQHRITRI